MKINYSSLYLFLAILPLIVSGKSFTEIPSYESLHPVIKFTLYEKNGQRPVTDDILDQLLPVEFLNMRNFDKVKNLEIIESTPDLKSLVLSPFIIDFSKLENYSLSNLTYLNASFSFISSDDLEKAQLPALETIDISASRVRSLEFVNSMPGLRRVVFIKHQISQEEVDEMRQKFPHIEFQYNTEVPPISRHFYFFEFKPYFDKLSPFFAGLRRSGFIMNVEVEVDAMGKVTSSRLTHHLRRVEEDSLSVLDLLIFAPDENPHKSNVVVRIPIEVS